MDASLGPCYVFVALCVLNGVRWLLLRSKIGFVHQHKMRLAQEIASLRKEAAAFNTPSTYVKCAKFQRLANAKEKELTALQEHKDSSLQDKIDAAVATAKVRTTAAGTAATASTAARPSHGRWSAITSAEAFISYPFKLVRSLVRHASMHAAAWLCRVNNSSNCQQRQLAVMPAGWCMHTTAWNLIVAT
jgi:hypothetical protein